MFTLFFSDWFLKINFTYTLFGRFLRTQVKVWMSIWQKIAASARMSFTYLFIYNDHDLKGIDAKVLFNIY